MKVFGLDTTRKKGNVFLIDTAVNSDAYVLSFDENIKHSEGMLLYVEKALLVNNLDIKDVDCFACIVGPGSFTGIRIGMSTIKGFNKALNKGVIAINTFELLLPVVKRGVILLNSTTTSCYYAEVDKSEIVSTGVIAKSEIETFANGREVVVLEEEQSLIDISYNKIKVVDNLSDLYRLCVLKKMDTMQYGDFQPYYLQLSQAERNLKDGKC